MRQILLTVLTAAALALAAAPAHAQSDIPLPPACNGPHPPSFCDLDLDASIWT